MIGNQELVMQSAERRESQLGVIGRAPETANKSPAYIADLHKFI